MDLYLENVADYGTMSTKAMSSAAVRETTLVACRHFFVEKQRSGIRPSVRKAGGFASVHCGWNYDLRGIT